MIALDLVPSADTPFFTHETTIDGREYVFDFAWNGRRSCWAVSMYTKTGEALFLAQTVRHGRNLLSRCRSSSAPAGALFCWSDTPSNETPPGVDELGGRVNIYYGTAADLL